jgi:PKHD-type hydroxylase
VILCLAGVLDAARLAAVRRLLATARFEPGEATAGWHARGVKHNEQAVGTDPAARAAAAAVADALRAHPVFAAAVLPRRLRPVLFSRCRVGDFYGPHVDDALMGGTIPVRTDVAVTVFLTPAADYAGGELVLETAGGEQEFRLAAGDAVAYPATSLHRVAPVTAGERLAAVTWVQSLVRDPARREVLFDLDTARRASFGNADGMGLPRAGVDTFQLLAKTYANLLRMWAEP